MAQKGGSFPKALLKEGTITLLIEAAKWVLVWLSPWLLAVLTVIAGIAQSIAWIWIIVLATFVFACATTGMLRFDEWRARRTPRDKLTFQNAFLGLDYVKDKNTGKTTAIDKAQAGLFLQNHAPFPISYVVDEIRSSLEGRVNPDPKHDTKGAVVQLNSGSLFRDATIDMDKLPIKQIVEGRLKFRLRYGREGNEKYKLERNLKLYASYDPNLGIYPVVSYQDAAE